MDLFYDVLSCLEPNRWRGSVSAFAVEPGPHLNAMDLGSMKYPTLLIITSSHDSLGMCLGESFQQVACRHCHKASARSMIRSIMIKTNTQNASSP